MTLNEKISAWFELRPEDFRSAPTGTLSHKGFWQWVVDPILALRRARPPLSDPLPNGRWVALNYDTDEAANARLLEEGKIHLWPTDGSPGGEGWAACSYVHLAQRNPTDMPIISFDKDRKTAVVLAFCKFAGIEDDSSPARGEFSDPTYTKAQAFLDAVLPILENFNPAPIGEREIQWAKGELAHRRERTQTLALMAATIYGDSLRTGFAVTIKYAVDASEELLAEVEKRK